MLDTLLLDVRYAVRTLQRSPGFTAAVVLTLGLGIGANTAIFSVVDGVLLRPAPVEDIGRLVTVWQTDRKSSTTREPSSIPDYFDFRQRATHFEQLAAFTPAEVNLTPPEGEPSRLAAIALTHEMLPMLGIRPLRGRVFNAEEDQPGGPRAVLISEDLWARLFGRSDNAIGQALLINDNSWTIVGVMPASGDFGMLQILGAAAYSRGFADRGGRPRVDVWAPLRAGPDASRDNHPIIVLGRLRAGTSVAAAQQEMATIGADLEREYPQSNDARGVNVEPLKEVVFGPVRPALLVLLGAVALVLLVACANVANLLLARGEARGREVTVRLALGAPTRRLVRQFLVESAVLVVAGAVLGVFVASSGLDLLLALAPASLPRVDDVGIDVRVLAATLVMSVVATVVFGLLPARQALRRGGQSPLHADARVGSGREQARFRSGLVVAELTLAVMLMAGAGLLIRSLWQLQQVNPGFQAAGVLKAEFALPASRYPRDFSVYPRWVETVRFTDELRRRVAAVPGVEAVAIAGAHPLDAGFTSSITVVGREAESHDWPEPAIRNVDAGYFEAVQLAKLDGRLFTFADDAGAPPVILINESARRRFFAGHEPIGQQIRLWGANRTVIGVVANERIRGLTEAAPPGVYLPLAQAPTSGGSVLVRTAGDPVAVAPSLRRIVRDLDAALPLFAVEPLERTLADSIGQRRFTMLVLGVFAAVALLLAVIGVHGVLSYTVSQRTREIGIRMALGADLGTVRSLVLSQGARMVVAGLGLGLVGALIVTRALTSLLYGVSPADPLTFGAIALLLAGVAMLACWLPAQRAARTDPLIAIRSE